MLGLIFPELVMYILRTETRHSSDAKDKSQAWYKSKRSSQKRGQNHETDLKSFDGDDGVGGCGGWPPCNGDRPAAATADRLCNLLLNCRVHKPLALEELLHCMATKWTTGAGTFWTPPQSIELQSPLHCADSPTALYWSPNISCSCSSSHKNPPYSTPVQLKSNLAAALCTCSTSFCCWLNWRPNPLFEKWLQTCSTLSSNRQCRGRWSFTANCWTFLGVGVGVFGYCFLQWKIVVNDNMWRNCRHKEVVCIKAAQSCACLLLLAMPKCPVLATNSFTLKSKNNFTEGTG